MEEKIQKFQKKIDIIPENTFPNARSRLKSKWLSSKLNACEQLILEI